MSVRIRMKRMGRRHRPYYRICAVDQRRQRDGKVLEELGTYDPMVPDVNARARIKGERVDYWLGVGAQPSDKVRVLIRKYGTNGSHLESQQAALEKLASKKTYVPPKVQTPPPKAEAAEEEAAPAPAEEATEESTVTATAEPSEAAEETSVAEEPKEGGDA